MKYIYIVFGNRNIGSKHWYQDKIFIAKLSAENYRKKLLKKYPQGAFLIEKEKIYE